ncbi:hypothetical protein [Geminocystis sp.]|uniref:hypothetical protein n=1 Tax=Geminocystis sp. TaxID=2664100 RepID=UPI00359417E1
MRSSKPSPLTSPALLTEAPETSMGLIPLMIKPLAPLRVDKLRVGEKPPLLPNTT